jgi:DNA-binding PadR family transcriptional regulator
VNENLVNPEVENDAVMEMHERIAKTFLDIFILRKLGESDERLSGYDFMKLVGEELNVMFSASSVYAILYSMEREGLVQGNSEGRKRVYSLTDKGKVKVRMLFEENAKIVHLFENLFE